MVSSTDNIVVTFNFSAMHDSINHSFYTIVIIQNISISMPAHSNSTIYVYYSPILYLAAHKPIALKLQNEYFRQFSLFYSCQWKKEPQLLPPFRFSVPLFVLPPSSPLPLPLPLLSYSSFFSCYSPFWWSWTEWVWGLSWPLLLRHLLPLQASAFHINCQLPGEC